MPPLRYEFVYQLKRDFPALTIVLNGGVKTEAEIAQHLQHIDGVMLGRHAYHEPWSMATWDNTFFNEPNPADAREDVEARWVEYLERCARAGTPWPTAARHAMGLWNSVPGARRWRQVWSDHRLKALSPTEVHALACAALAPAVADAAL